MTKTRDYVVPISVIAAVQKKDRLIGKDNSLPWYIPADLQRFKALTTGHAVIMGRKTFESIIARIGKPLPNRINIVVTRKSDYRNGAHGRGRTFDGALIVAKSVSPAQSEIFVLGGAEIYREALPKADKLYLTLVDGNYTGDTYFPDYSMFDTEVFREDHFDHNPPFSFIDLVKS